jgi:hypothetical protein
MKRTTKIFCTIAWVVITLISASCCEQMKDESKTKTCGIDAVTLKTDMRKLWEDHVIWTRNVIFCIVDELPGKSEAVKRLLQNQVDIGNIFKLYYGEETGSKLTKLLYVHINTFAEVAQAAKTNNTPVHDEANKRLVANADEISEFLCKANPNWALTDMKMMMQEHLKITTDEAMQRINKNYDADVIAFDKTNKEILIMADMFTDGIIKQFQEKF